MDSINDILPKIIDKYNLSDSSHSSHILRIAEKYCIDTWGENILEHVQIKKYKNGTLYIKSKDASLSTEIYFHINNMKDYIINHIKNSGLENIKVSQ